MLRALGAPAQTLVAAICGMKEFGALVLRTDRLFLRPLEMADAETLWPDISDPEIAKLMAWTAHSDKQQTVDFLNAEVARREAGRGVTWAIFKDESFCGIVSLIGLMRTHRALTYNKAEFAYWAGRRFQRQGLMTEACRRVMAFAFRELELHKLVVGHFGANTASRKLIERLGFRYVGTQAQEFCKDGIWHDHFMYELLAREYLTQPGGR